MRRAITSQTIWSTIPLFALVVARCLNTWLRKIFSGGLSHLKIAQHFRERKLNAVEDRSLYGVWRVDLLKLLWLLNIAYQHSLALSSLLFLHNYIIVSTVIYEEMGNYWLEFVIYGDTKVYTTRPNLTACQIFFTWRNLIFREILYFVFKRAWGNGNIRK